jgi:hypothetical protein
MQKRKREKPKKSSNPLSEYYPYLEGMLIGVGFAGAGLILTVCMLCLAFIALVIASNPSSYDHWAEFLQTPLDKNTVDELCSTGAIPNSMEVCNRANRIMIFAQIKEMMKYYLGHEYTYSEINALFEAYEVSCHESPDSKIFRCSYKFGDYKLFLVFDVITNDILRIEG